MKKRFFIFTFLIIFLIVFKGAAQGFGPGGDPPDDRKPLNIQEMKTRLGLTDEQVNKISKLMEDTRKKLELKEIEKDKIMISIREEMIKDNPNLDSIKSLIEKKQSIMSEIEFLIIKRDIDIRGILTKEQFEKMGIYFRRAEKKHKMIKKNFRPY